MNLTIQLPDEEGPILKAKATARGVSAEPYALQVLEQDLAAVSEPRTGHGRFDNLSDLLLSSPFACANPDLVRSRDQPRTIDPGWAGSSSTRTFYPNTTRPGGPDADRSALGVSRIRCYIQRSFR